SAFALEERPACSRHGHRKKRAGAAKVDQVQTIGSEPRGEGQIEGVQVGGPVALHGQIDVALRACPVSGCRTEQDEEPEIRHHLGKISEALLDELGGGSGGHVVTVSERRERGQGNDSVDDACKRSRRRGGTTSTQSSTPSELALDDPREGLEWLSSREQLAVDEEGGRARHAETNRLVHALLHCGRMGPAREAALEPRELQPDLLSVGLELLGAGLGRVGEKRVVILPELPL